MVINYKNYTHSLVTTNKNLCKSRGEAASTFENREKRFHYNTLKHKKI